MKLKHVLLTLLSFMALNHAKHTEATWICVGEDTDCCAVHEDPRSVLELDEYEQEELATFVLTAETIERLMEDFAISDTGSRYALLFVKETRK